MRESLTRAVVAGILILAAGCDRSILDIPPQDRVAESAVWGDENLTRAYHNELYHVIPHEFARHMTSKFTDESFNNVPANQSAYRFRINDYSPDNIQGTAGDVDARMYFWDHGYTYIRKINLFLDKAQAGDLTISDLDRMVAEAKFLRAYTYFELMKRFGGVPIVDRTYNLSDMGNVNFTRNTLAEVVAFIEKDVAEALPDLPNSYATNSSNFGRATRDASWALLSRMRLYYASPLHNPNNDMSRWQAASDAALQLIDANRYDLHANYEELFSLPSGATRDELIFARNFTTSTGHQAPMHNLPRRWGGYGGWWASNGPSQNLVDAYDMINGEPAFLDIDEQIINPASGYDPANPYANRDPRFEASILHNGSEIWGITYETWERPDGQAWAFDSYRQGPDNPRTNYALRKFMPPAGTAISWAFQYTQPWPVFRMAEIYLNYAEAQLELGNESVTREYISKVRERVGMPEIPATVTGEALREKLINERRIELAFEGHRFWDIRRWLIAAEVENTPIRGMNVVQDLSGVTTYTSTGPLLIKNPYQEKMNLLPIASAELLRNPELTQTPGW